MIISRLHSEKEATDKRDQHTLFSYHFVGFINCNKNRRKNRFLQTDKNQLPPDLSGSIPGVNKFFTALTPRLTPRLIPAF
jgi:hypothetical protein